MTTLAMLGRKDGIGFPFQVLVIIEATLKFDSLESLGEESFSSLPFLSFYLQG